MLEARGPKEAGKEAEDRERERELGGEELCSSPPIPSQAPLRLCVDIGQPGRRRGERDREKRLWEDKLSSREVRSRLQGALASPSRARGDVSLGVIRNALSLSLSLCLSQVPPAHSSLLQVKFRPRR